LAGDGTAQNTRDRIAGVKDSLEGTALNLVEVLLDDIRPDVALNNAWTAMQSYPDLAGLITLYPYEGPVVGQAVSDAGKSGEVKVVAFGAEPDTQRLMEQGIVQAIIGERTYFYGYLSAYVMYAMSVLGEQETLRVLEPYLSDWPARPSGDVVPGSEGRIHLNTGFDVVDSDSLGSYQAYLERIGVTSQ